MLLFKFNFFLFNYKRFFLIVFFDKFNCMFLFFLLLIFIIIFFYSKLYLNDHKFNLLLIRFVIVIIFLVISCNLFIILI